MRKGREGKRRGREKKEKEKEKINVAWGKEKKEERKKTSSCQPWNPSNDNL